MNHHFQCALIIFISDNLSEEQVSSTSSLEMTDNSALFTASKITTNSAALTASKMTANSAVFTASENKTVTEP